MANNANIQTYKSWGPTVWGLQSGGLQSGAYSLGPYSLGPYIGALLWVTGFGSGNATLKINILDPTTQALFREKRWKFHFKNGSYSLTSLYLYRKADKLIIKSDWFDTNRV